MTSGESIPAVVAAAEACIEVGAGVAAAAGVAGLAEEGWNPAVSGSAAAAWPALAGEPDAAAAEGAVVPAGLDVGVCKKKGHLVAYEARQSPVDSPPSLPGERLMMRASRITPFPFPAAHPLNTLNPFDFLLFSILSAVADHGRFKR